MVVLGCRLLPDGRPTGQLRRRVALGVELYKAGIAPLILLSGGGAPVSEAAAMHEMALEWKVPPAALLCETASCNTVENAVHSRELLRQQGLSRVVLVSSRTHLFRARLLFRMAGLTVAGTAGVAARSRAAAMAASVYEAVALPRSLLRMIRQR